MKKTSSRRAFVQQSAFGLYFPFFGPWTELAGADKNEKLKPFVLPAQPPLEPLGGLQIRTWVRQSMTGWLYSSVECAVGPGTMGPPPHYHLELDELMYVAEGTAYILMDKEVVKVEAGGWHLRPRMIPHTFFNPEKKPLRFYDMYFQQPFEEYLEAVFFKINDANGFPEGSKKKMDEMDKLNKKFGLVFPPDAFNQKDALIKEYGLK
jgi:mannose-6-phosphate isomerase-like protein (cupin superfamily)